jgi:hypothetical protein
MNRIFDVIFDFIRQTLIEQTQLQLSNNSIYLFFGEFFGGWAARRFNVLAFGFFKRELRKPGDMDWL